MIRLGLSLYWHLVLIAIFGYFCLFRIPSRYSVHVNPNHIIYTIMKIVARVEKKKKKKSGCQIKLLALGHQSENFPIVQSRHVLTTWGNILYIPKTISSNITRKMSTTKYMNFWTEKGENNKSTLNQYRWKHQHETNIQSQNNRNNISIDNLELYWSCWKTVINIQCIIICWIYIDVMELIPTPTARLRLLAPGQLMNVFFFFDPTLPLRCDAN